jgi:hypothetical protein
MNEMTVCSAISAGQIFSRPKNFKLQEYNINHHGNIRVEKKMKEEKS